MCIRPLVLCCLLGLPGLVSAQEVRDAQKIVDQALAAGGGEARLSNLKAAVWKTRAVAHFTGSPVPSTGTLYGQLPNSFRRESTSVRDGKSETRVYIVNGNRGWSKQGDEVKSLTDQELLAEKDTFFHKQAALTLVPLKGKGVDLQYVGEDKVEGRPVAVVRAKKQGFHDITLYFDKSSHLVVKSEGVALDARTGKETKLEHYYSQHKDFDGIKYPTKTVTLRDGKLMLEVETLEFKPQSQIEASKFLP